MHLIYSYLENDNMTVCVTYLLGRMIINKNRFYAQFMFVHGLTTETQSIFQYFVECFLCIHPWPSKLWNTDNLQHLKTKLVCVNTMINTAKCYEQHKTWGVRPIQNTKSINHWIVSHIKDVYFMYSPPFLNTKNTIVHVMLHVQCNKIAVCT